MCVRTVRTIHERRDELSGATSNGCHQSIRHLHQLFAQGRRIRHQAGQSAAQLFATEGSARPPPALQRLSRSGRHARRRVDPGTGQQPAAGVEAGCPVLARSAREPLRQPRDRDVRARAQPRAHRSGSRARAGEQRSGAWTRVGDGLSGGAHQRPPDPVGRGLPRLPAGQRRHRTPRLRARLVQDAGRSLRRFRRHAGADRAA